MSLQRLCVLFWSHASHSPCDVDQIAQEKLLYSASSIDRIHEDFSVFGTMLADLYAMRSGVDRTLRMIESKCPTSASFRKWEPRFSTNAAVSIEMVGCEELPFSKRDVDRAMFLHRHDKTRNYRSLDIQVGTIA